MLLSLESFLQWKTRNSLSYVGCKFVIATPCEMDAVMTNVRKCYTSVYVGSIQLVTFVLEVLVESVDVGSCFSTLARGYRTDVKFAGVLFPR